MGKLRGTSIGKLHPDGEGLLVNDSGTFIIDEAVNIDWKSLADIKMPKIGKCFCISTPMIDNPLFEYQIEFLKNHEPKRIIAYRKDVRGRRLIERLFTQFKRIASRRHQYERHTSLWENDNDLMYEGIRHMLWLEDIEDHEMFPSLKEYDCDYCSFDLLNFTEVMAGHPQENDWIKRTNYLETCYQEWGFGADWTETVTCPRCGHTATWSTGYP